MTKKQTDDDFYAECSYCGKLEDQMGEHKEACEVLDPRNEKDPAKFMENNGLPKYICMCCIVEITANNRPSFHRSYYRNL
jgi:hypothetical protein